MPRNLESLLPEVDLPFLPLPSFPTLGGWRDLGIPDQLLPAPPPFLPLPKGLIMEMEGLDMWTAYAMYPPNVMEEIGTVYGASEAEALEAAEEIHGVNGAVAFKVVRG